MDSKNEVLRLALQALEGVCNVTVIKTQNEAVHAAVVHEIDEWRAPFDRWLAAECIGYNRLLSSVTSLHDACCDWELSQGGVPCTSSTFERLLLEQNWIIDDGFVSGLAVSRTVRESGYFPELFVEQ